MAITANDKIIIATVDGEGGAAMTAITVADFLASTAFEDAVTALTT
jgi:hypothetical protein